MMVCRGYIRPHVFSSGAWKQEFQALELSVPSPGSNASMRWKQTAVWLVATPASRERAGKAAVMAIQTLFIS